MSSSTSSISRSRSLRKPLINNNNINTNNASNGSTGSSVADGASAGSNVRDGGGPTPRTLSPTRLPVKGGASSSLARSASIRTVSTASSTAGPGGGASSSSTTTAAKRTRPLSGILGRSRQESVSKEKGDNTTTTASSTSGDVSNSRPPRTATTRAAIGGTGIGQSRPPSSSGPLTRSNSMARPTTSSGVPNSSNARPARAPSGHARTKSSITTLTGATTLRPPSQTSADSGGSSAGTAAADRSRPPITRSAAVTQHKRNISNPAAAPSSRTIPTTTSTSKPPPSTTSTSSRHSPTGTDPFPAADHHRPAFNTHQQHYSPAKSLAPKPLTSTFLAPPSPSKLPSNVALSAEIARLQTELLQLHLLHRDFSSVDGQWRSSARYKLGERFTQLVKEQSQVGKLEESVVEMRNLKALVEWGAAGVEGLEGRIQMLDEVLCGVWSLGEPGGRYTRVVRRFEKWMGRVREVSEARRLFNRIRKGEGEGEKVTGELLGNEGLADLLLLMSTATGEEKQGKTKGQGQVLLDAEWKEECAMLTRRLSEWRRILNGLMMIPTAEQHQDETVDGENSSSLAKILKACSSLVDDMLAELKLMEQTERDAVAAENAWVRAVNRDQDEHCESLLPSQRGASTSTRAGAIWRAF